MRSAVTTTLAFLTLSLLAAPGAHAVSRLELDTRAKASLEKLYERHQEARSLGEKAVAILVLPRVIKAGMGVGAEYGEGALLVGDTTAQYYRVTSVTLGFQLGAQGQSEVIMFMTEEARRSFVESDGWEAGVDGSIAVVEFGVGRELDTHTIKNPIIGFVFNNKGLMYNLSLEGTKFWKINK